MENLVTTNSIIEWFTEQISNKFPIDPNLWLDGAMKLSVLLQGEQEILFTLEQEVAKLKNILLEDGKSVAFAKAKIEATDEYKFSRVQRAKIERCVEFIRLAKIYSRTASDIFKNQL